MKRLTSGGGWSSILYAIRLADRLGWRRLATAMKSKNTCKTCALGMGGQLGAMRNERGQWPAVCKKSLQAMAADMQDGIRPEFFAQCSLSQLQSLSSRELEAAGRLVEPLCAGADDSHFRTVSWDAAVARIAAKLNAIEPDQAFFYTSGRSSNEAGFLLHLFARLFGTNNVNNCSFYCHQASGVGLNDTIGTGTATVVLEDLEGADLFFLIGGNPASNHPRLMHSLVQLRRRGGHVIVVNPIRETGLVNFRVPSDWRSLLLGSPIASEYVQLHIGGDIAFLTGVAKAVIEKGAHAKDFIDQATEGFDDFRRDALAAQWDAIEQSAGVSRDQIVRVAEIYARSKSAIFGWTMGITHHEHGVANVQQIANLALLRGMVGRRHAGLLPIRGHSNVQGIGSVGVTPKLRTAVFERIESHFGVRLPTAPGMDTMASVQAASNGRVRFALCLGGNLFGSNPDARFAQAALANIDLVVYLSTSLNTGHIHGRGRETIILPVLARDEDPQKTTQESMFNYVRLSDGGSPRHQGPRSEVVVIADIAGRVVGDGSPIDWQGMRQHATIRAAISKIVPGYEKMSAMDVTHNEFQVGGRTLHAPRFPSANGKAHFRPPSIPARCLAPNELQLMTIRSEGQFNTVVYEEEDVYRGQERRDVVLMHRSDMDRLHLEDNDRVSVRSASGVMHNVLAREFPIRMGNVAMYYPEANVLVPAIVDPRSRTPAFKSVRVTVERHPLSIL